MITTPTTFILGAGASAPYGYPTAKGLRDSILDNLLNDVNEDFQMLKSCGFLSSEITGFRENFFYSVQNSVDAFLERRTEFINVGKAAIAQQLIKAEQNAVSLFTENWYSYLLKRMDCTFADFAKNKVSFITFNYDRSLEHFFAVALKARYNKTIEEVSKVLKAIPIIHVYGHMGSLEWQSVDRKVVRKYGDISGSDAIKLAAKHIKIVSERESDETEEILAARNCILEADRILFLGFGYHPENMRRLKIPFENSGASPKFFGGSGKGLTDVEINDLTHRLYHGLHIGHSSRGTLEYLRNEQKFAED